MRVFNTLTRQKEEFVPLKENRALIYCCGPTVYNLIHVGNARPMIAFDVLRRHLLAQGWQVTFVQNFTDIDDKVIRRAQEEGTCYDAVAARYIEEYYTDARGLNVMDADIAPKATENIPAIISLVARLVDREFAYETRDGVYFRVGRFAEYGKLSHQPMEDLLSGARVDTNEDKEAPADFALWKRAKEGEPFWPSPWGDGRPGWHIECSAMAGRHLGSTIDIHCGGQDLIFPHHENEIAQSEAAFGCAFARYWMHNGFLSIDNQKMSKSLGNFFTVREAAKAYGYEAIRLFMLGAHYRSPLNYSEESLNQAAASLKRLTATRDNLSFLMEHAQDKNGAPDPAVEQALAAYRVRFDEALDDDLNTADAIGTLFEMVRDINTRLQANASFGQMLVCQSALRGMLDVLGLLQTSQVTGLEDEIEALIERRQQARAAKNFQESDRIRDELKSRGIVLEDTPQGVKWRRE